MSYNLYGFGPANSQSAFLPEDFYLPEDSEQARDILAQRENLTATTLNVREIGQYELEELITGQTWFSGPSGNQFNGRETKKRTCFRRTFNLVELNNGPIVAGATIIRIYPPISGIVIPINAFGGATITGPQYVFLPSPNLDIVMDNTDPEKQTLTITNNVGSDLIQCYVTIEYLKQS